MRRIIRSSEQGVTLLEIMLVLAIAAMVIVMSIRYYQGATNSQQINLASSELQAITSAADNLAIGPGTYSNVTTATVQAIVGSSNMISPTGGTVTVTDGQQNTYKVTMPLNDSICQAIKAQISGNKKMTSPDCSGGTLTYTYNNSMAT